MVAHFLYYSEVYEDEVKQDADADADADAQMHVEMYENDCGNRTEDELSEFNVYEFAREIERNRIQLSW